MLKRLTPKQRGLAVLACQLVALVLAFFALPIARYFVTVDRIDASASSEYDENFTAQMAIDGDPETEWCTADGVLGTFDLAFNRRRKIDAVWITNGHNRGYMDRAIRRAKLTLYDGGRAVGRHVIELPGIEPKHVRRRIELSGQRATRLRLEVLEFAGSGSALAEISVE
jgi:hypothetical protein